MYNLNNNIIYDLFRRVRMPAPANKTGRRRRVTTTIIDILIYIAVPAPRHAPAGDRRAVGRGGAPRGPACGLGPGHVRMPHYSRGASGPMALEARFLKSRG